MSEDSILIVEDEVIVAENLSRKLKNLGYTVAGIAVSGNEAIEMVHAFRPQLLLMDIKLQGDLDGIETVTEVRKHHDLPVIYLTAHSDRNTLDRAKASRPNGYILKPFDERDLKIQIEMALYKHEADRKVREQREWLRVTLASIGDAVIATDADGIITFLNPIAEAVTGWPGDEAVGKPLKEVFCIVNEYTRAPVDDPVHKVLQTGAIVGLANHTVLIGRNGKEVPIDDSGAPIKDNAGRILGVVLVFRDISESKQSDKERAILQEQLAQAQKMESVGRLAGGVAHDFNNMLGVIIGHAELAMEQLDQASPAYEDMMAVRKAAQRSADLTRQLLAFARQQTSAPMVLDLNKTVDKMQHMIHRMIGEDIEFKFVPAENLYPVKIDPSQIDQIVTNLCVNSRDAIKGTGKIVIETQNTVLDDDCAQRTGCTPGGYVMLAVTDTGSGIAKKDIKNLFEPFFTTKKIGEGTGLGLSTVYGIVKQNNGYIEVDSEPGQGASFRICLPQSREGCHQEAARLSLEIAGGNETVLLVEDEGAILNLVKAVLQRYGYHVLVAGTPRDALSLVKACKEPIHLVVTDVVMPEMNGWELKEALQKLIPEAKILFMSGYTANIVADRGVLEKDVEFLQKPFSKESLAKKVREVLDRDDLLNRPGCSGQTGK